MLIFYGSPQCHLCEQALALIETYLNECNTGLKKVNVLGDLSLKKRYGLRIPVIKDSRTDCELAWPFGAEDFQVWLSSL